MNEWLLEQINKKEEVIHEKEDVILDRDESMRWIKWTIPVSMVVILVGFYFISVSKVVQTGTWDVSSSSAKSFGWNHSLPLDFRSVLEKQSNDSPYAHIWGKENMKFSPEKELQIFYPAGSYSPSSDPRGWAGFIYRLDSPLETAKLSYKLKFEKGFDFVKWGKLPGFCSQECPRGGTDIGNWFSTRFMWRADGDLEGYLYIPGEEGTYGKSFWRGSFRFEPGKYYKIEQQLKLNSPGKEDGLIVINVDGTEVFRDAHVKLREWLETKIDRIIFSTFFGGSDKSFATKKDTHVTFKDFVLYN